MVAYPTKSDYLDETEIDEALDRMPERETVETTAANLRSNGFGVEIVDDGEAALETVVDAIPPDVSVNLGHSTTLEEIGFVDLLAEGDHSWRNLKREVIEEEDPETQQRKRRESMCADYFLGSVNAVARTGELVAGDGGGSRVGGYPYAAEHVIIVAGTNKIVDSVDRARERLRTVAFPLEDQRIRDVHGIESGSRIGKELIYHYESTDGRTTVVLVDENLGF